MLLMLLVQIWNFLSTDTKEVGNFAFFLLTQKKMVNENNFSKDQLKKILEIIHGKNFARNKELKKVTDQLFTVKVSKMQDFLGWCDSHPVLISPIIRLQHTLRETILGDDFWYAAVTKRYKSDEASTLGFVTDITADANKKYVIMEKEIEAQKRNREFQNQKARRVSVAKIVEKARRMTQHFQKNAKIVTTLEKKDVKKPDHKRSRRSFIKPKIKAKGGKSDEASARAPKKVHSVPSQHLYNLVFSRVVVIDDEYAVGKATVATLRDMGISSDYVQCQVAVDGLLCVENSMRENRPFEAVFLDGFMPGDDGPAVARKLRSLGFASVIIGMCAEGDCIDRAAFVASGANAVLSKPLTQAAVRETLTALTPVIGQVLDQDRKNRVSKAMVK
jgi:CheY-like chemotaxis protein